MGISITELIVIFIVFLILFGPEKLPEIFSQIGKIAGQLKKHSDALRREFYNSVYTPANEIKSEVDSVARGLITFKADIKNSNAEINELIKASAKSESPATIAEKSEEPKND